MAVYNDDISVEVVNEGVQVSRRPDENRLIETSELKKGAIRLLSNDSDKVFVGEVVRNAERFDAMNDSMGDGFPEFSVDEASVEGQIVQFFEQAFEWTNITYTFYPYYWARKEKWIETQGRYDADPEFTQFLRAGAARLVVPVHPAYEAAVLHYFHTKEICLGEQPPVLDDEVYESLVEDLKGSTQYDPPEELPINADGGQTPCVLDTWEVTLPTSLVYLQETAALPKFEVPIFENDIERILDERAAAMDIDLNWRSSVVDLLKVIDLDSDIDARRKLAAKLGYQGSESSREMNIWLHGKITQVLMENSGSWPETYNS